MLSGAGRTPFLTRGMKRKCVDESKLFIFEVLLPSIVIMYFVAKIMLWIIN